VSETVEADFRRLGFFEAVAVLGQGGMKLRFRAAASLGFPAHEIAAAGWEEGLNGEPRFTLTVPFLGLYGPASPLPTFYTERLLQDEPASRNQRDFLDIFNHVAIALLVQIHQRTRALIEKALPAVAARTGVNAQVSLRLFTLAVPSRALLLKTWMVSPRASLTGRVPLMVGVRSLVWPPLGINPAALETAVMTGLPMRC
jgi:hypothetical protein